MNMEKQEKSTVIGHLRRQIENIDSQCKSFLQKKETKSSLSRDKLEKYFQNSNLIINQVFLSFLINRTQNGSEQVKHDEYFTQARKLIATILSKWEEILDKNFDNLYESNKLIHKFYENSYIFDHFKKIGFCIDYFDFFYKNNTRWQTSLLAIRYRYLIILSNALNLKKLLKECDPEFEDYIKNLEICELIKLIFEECADIYWKKNIQAEKMPLAEMNKGMNLITFLKNFTSMTKDQDAYQRLKKKHATWKKYIDLRSKEEAENK